MSDPVATNLLGRTVSWYGDRGKEGGPVVAVTYQQANGQFMLLINTDTGLRMKGASGLTLED